MTAFAGVDTVRLLEQGMRVAVTNHTFIANNIANVDTPNYNPVRMDFQSTLRAALEGRDRFALRQSHPRHLEATREMLTYDRKSVFSKNDDNKVDLEEEMASLSENTGRYSLYSGLLRKHFAQVKGMLSNIR